MTPRDYTSLADKDIRESLEQLLALVGDTQGYRRQMITLGEQLGSILAQRLQPEETVYVACTVEDADFLTSGLLSKLHAMRSDLQIYFACFWNERETIGEQEKLDIAPVIKRYAEAPDKKIDSLVVTKSIISGTCVVRTNLLELLSLLDPTRVFVVAPVMHDRAEEKLNQAFPTSVSDRFSYITFACDHVRRSSGEIEPGVGGSVYELLGLGGPHDKNRYRPRIVLERRKKMFA